MHYDQKETARNMKQFAHFKHCNGVWAPAQNLEANPFVVIDSAIIDLRPMPSSVP